MSEIEPQPAESKEASTPPPPPEERRLELPGWVPAAIGLTLVLLASMAVYTGFSTRVRPQPATESPADVSPFSMDEGIFIEEAGGAPGAPGPGDSRVTPEGDVPVTGSAPEDGSPMSISGDGASVSGRMSLAVRRGLVFDVTPEDAALYVNDVAVGTARQFSSTETAYEFSEAGVFSVKIAAPGHAEVELVVNAGPDAPEETAVVALRLSPVR